MATDTEEEHPKFIEAVDAIERLQASGEADPEAVFPWLRQAAEYAPDSLRAEIIGIMYRKGRFPETPYVTPDGKPLYTAVPLAEHLDLTVEDIHFHIGLFHSQGILVIP
jgi:hypothetical protein